jgi:hypothetical protein
MAGDEQSRVSAQEPARPPRPRPPEDGWERELPDLASALRHGSVSFDQLLEARSGRDGAAAGADPSKWRAYGLAYPRLLEEFQRIHGDIQSIVHGPNGSGAALTVKPPPSPDPAVRRLPWNAPAQEDRHIHLRFAAAETACVLDLQDRCEFFRVQQFRLTQQHIAPYLERLLDAARAVVHIDETKKDGLQDKVKAADGVLTDVRHRYEWILNRKARTDYLKGVAYGLCGVAVGLLVWLVVLAAFLKGDPTVVWCMAGGALAAAANAMLRLVQGSPTVQGEESHLLITFFGAFRPALGAAFALIAYALVVGGILPVKVPADAHTLFWFVIGISFIAGFTEGFTPDLVQTAARQIGGSPAPSSTAPDQAAGTTPGH